MLVGWGKQTLYVGDFVCSKAINVLLLGTGANAERSQCKAGCKKFLLRDVTSSPRSTLFAFACVSLSETRKFFSFLGLRFLPLILQRVAAVPAAVGSKGKVFWDIVFFVRRSQNANKKPVSEMFCPAWNFTSLGGIPIRMCLPNKLTFIYALVYSPQSTA